jgi:hypothetical protein
VDGETVTAQVILDEARAAAAGAINDTTVETATTDLVTSTGTDHTPLRVAVAEDFMELDIPRSK